MTLSKEELNKIKKEVKLEILSTVFMTVFYSIIAVGVFLLVKEAWIKISSWYSSLSENWQISLFQFGVGIVLILLSVFLSVYIDRKYIRKFSNTKTRQKRKNTNKNKLK